MKKFTSNDIFRNILLANPKYVIAMRSGSLRINDQISQNNEYSSSLNGIDYGGTYEYPKYGYTGSYSYTSSISREFIYSTSSAFGPYSKTFNYYYTNYRSIQKVAALKNIFPGYIFENQYANLSYYLLNNGIPYYQLLYGQASSATNPLNSPGNYILPTQSLNLIDVPRTFYGNYIKPGSLQLNMYVSGVLTASAIDSDKTGKIIQTLGNGSGSVIGSIFYDHGLLLLTASHSLSSEQAPYIQPLANYTASASPINDSLKWIYFGSYSNTTGSGIETKYELIFQGVNSIPTMTLMCHAEKNELMWSNNRSFIEAGQGDDLFVGQTTSSTNITGTTYYSTSGSVLIPSDNTFRENPMVTIKNTISSSFANYSASYEPQVFISQIGIYDKEKNLIGIAKLANPVKKIKSLDYTFKIKLDL